MDKRFFSFMIVMILVTMIYINIYTALFPPPKRPPKPAIDDQIVQDDTDDGSNDGKGDDSADDTGDDTAGDDNAGDDTAIGPDSDDEEKAKSEPRRFVSIGSLDPDSPYRFLAIFDSKGGNLWSLELNELKKNGKLRYRDLIDPSGYLGRLALSNESDGGCRINVNVKSSDGTPASQAKPTASTSEPGLRQDDVILKLNGTKLTDKDHLQTLVSKTRPGEEVALLVDRNGKEIRFSAELTSHPLPIIRPEGFSVESLDIKSRAKYDPDGNGVIDYAGSLLLTLGEWKGTNWKAFGLNADSLPAMHTENWQLVADENDADVVEFRFELGQDLLNASKSSKVEVVKRFRLAETPKDEQDNRFAKSYHLDFDFEIKNIGKRSKDIAYQLDGPRGLPLEGWWYQNKVGPAWGAAGARDVAWTSKGSGFNLWRCPAVVSYVVNEKPFQNQFFSAIVKNKFSKSENLNTSHV